jgi:hypothetical protein
MPDISAFDADPSPGSADAVVTEMLAPLNDEQQRVVDLIGEGFLARGGDWPVFDYLEGELDAVGLDAWAMLESLPRIDGFGSYSVARWPRRPGTKPPPNQPIALTVLGLHHSRRLGEQATAVIFAFLAFLPALAEWRRSQPRSPSEPRQLSASLRK